MESARHRSPSFMPHPAVDRAGRLVAAVVPFALAVLTAFAAVAVAARASEMSTRSAIALVGGGMLLIAALVTRRVKQLLLFAWVFTLTYNRQYFSFEALVGYHAGQGPYWIVADIFLAGLLLIWALEVILGRSSVVPRGPRVWLWYLPFAASCLLSGIAAERLDWTMFEMIRVAKVGLVLCYARYNLGRREWWICAAALGAAVAVQSTLGLLEVTFERSGVLWLFGLGGTAADIPDQFRPEAFYGWYRATGTMNHPPNLACYLILVIPAALALALSAPRRSLRAAGLFVGVLGWVGLTCTLSRWPWMLGAVQGVLLLAGLVVLRQMPVQRAAGLFVVVVFAAAAGMLPFAERIADRVTRDLEASVDQRLGGLKAAIGMFNDTNPILGAGLNNYRVHFLKYEPEVAWIEEHERLTTNTLNLRFIAAPENGFAFVLAETGLLGLSAFTIYMVGVMRIMWRAVATAKGYVRAMALGLSLGIFGVLAQQIIDYSLWVDPVLYSFTLVIGMLNNIPSAGTAAPDGGKEQPDAVAA